MKNFLILIFFICIAAAGTGCGRVQPHKDFGNRPSRIFPDSDNYFTFFVDEYVAACQKLYINPEICEDARDIPINFLSHEKIAEIFGREDIRGYAAYTPEGSEILISENQRNVDYFSMLGLIFHELGHAHLGRGHNEDVDIYKNRFQPLSIMFPWGFENGFFSDFLNLYTIELFTKQNFVAGVLKNNPSSALRFHIGDECDEISLKSNTLDEFTDSGYIRTFLNDNATPLESYEYFLEQTGENSFEWKRKLLPAPRQFNLNFTTRKITTSTGVTCKLQIER